jgi:hypothetical protein
MLTPSGNHCSPAIWMQRRLHLLSFNRTYKLGAPITIIIITSRHLEKRAHPLILLWTCSRPPIATAILAAVILHLAVGALTLLHRFSDRLLVEIHHSLFDILRFKEPGNIWHSSPLRRRQAKSLWLCPDCCPHVRLKPSLGISARFEFCPKGAGSQSPGLACYSPTLGKMQIQCQP